MGPKKKKGLKGKPFTSVYQPSKKKRSRSGEPAPAPAAAAAAAAAAVVFDSEDEDLSEVPEGSEMIGMRFSFIGSFSNPKKPHLIEKVEQHGGEVEEKTCGASVTHLVAASRASSKTARWKEAEDLDIPIVVSEFVLALALRNPAPLAPRHRPPRSAKPSPKRGVRLSARLLGRARPGRGGRGGRKKVVAEEDEDDDDDEAMAAAAAAAAKDDEEEEEEEEDDEGILLRQRKYLQPYLLGGGHGDKLGRVKDLLADKGRAMEEGEGEAAGAAAAADAAASSLAL
ncbi:unnamed protein product [Vitrella brassicaformis CCMP3155]|uniref:BRCT domain-containing protein n=1 Tax=Vitrella brassicaformis (strain CCMP3155) TaxID=1169540 RepID=A0A0G4H522_VITBC|nr:unnamed protein product [Vitrella brassicaformis CCMP3155]|eukprot:CEM38663.1 unnamed protein product [Vitrella brassicaformis CCMP3155]